MIKMKQQTHPPKGFEWYKTDIHIMVKKTNNDYCACCSKKNQTHMENDKVTRLKWIKLYALLFTFIMSTLVYNEETCYLYYTSSSNLDYLLPRYQLMKVKNNNLFSSWIIGLRNVLMDLLILLSFSIKLSKCIFNC